MGAPVLHLQSVAEGATGFFKQAVDVHVGCVDVIVRRGFGHPRTVVDGQRAQPNLGNRLGCHIKLVC
ncbi:hypothetical protein D3C76_704600 [compost metagenome]